MSTLISELSAFLKTCPKTCVFVVQVVSCALHVIEIVCQKNNSSHKCLLFPGHLFRGNKECSTRGSKENFGNLFQDTTQCKM